MKFLPVGVWGEHGAWAMVLTSLGAGLVLGRPPSWQAWLLLPAGAFLTGTKGLAQITRRTGRGWGVLAGFALAGMACAVPTALAAPLPFAVVAAVAGPFAVLYFWLRPRLAGRDRCWLKRWGRSSWPPPPPWPSRRHGQVPQKILWGSEPLWGRSSSPVSSGPG